MYQLIINVALGLCCLVLSGGVIYLGERLHGARVEIEKLEGYIKRLYEANGMKVHKSTRSHRKDIYRA